MKRAPVTISGNGVAEVKSKDIISSDIGQKQLAKVKQLKERLQK